MTQKAGPGAPESGAALKSIAHELGNLAYRLTFLKHNLSQLIPETSRRDETADLLEDTAGGLNRAAERLRSLATRE